MAAKRKLTCEYCGKEFEITERKARGQTKIKGFPQRYCNRQCSGLSRRIVPNSEQLSAKEYAAARARIKRQAQIDKGLCTECDNPATISIYCEKHYKARNAARELKKQNGLCVRCGIKTNGGTLCDEHKRLLNDSGKKIRLQLKIDTLNAYGGCKCACCGDTHLEFLTLDHINNDGAKHRREIGGHNSATSFYKKLKDSGYPDCGLRVLCYNCNCARAHAPDGKCPHERESPKEIKDSNDESYLSSDCMLWM